MCVDVGEVWGVCEALSWVKELDFDRVIVEMDSKRVHDAILAPSLPDTIFGDFIAQAKVLLRDN
ncbi:hypothetical protein ACS0TY_014203 [Phlomoides rotata]